MAEEKKQSSKLFVIEAWKLKGRVDSSRGVRRQTALWPGTSRKNGRCENWPKPGLSLLPGSPSASCHPPLRVRCLGEAMEGATSRHRCPLLRLYHRGGSGAGTGAPAGRGGPGQGQGQREPGQRRGASSVCWLGTELWGKPAWWSATPPTGTPLSMSPPRLTTSQVKDGVWMISNQLKNSCYEPV